MVLVVDSVELNDTFLFCNCMGEELVFSIVGDVGGVVLVVGLEVRTRD